MSKVNDNIEVLDTPDSPITSDELLINEGDILKALTEGDIHAGSIETIECKLGSVGKFAFRIRPLSEREYDKCRERATKYAKNRRLGGMRLPESTDTTAYHTELIYTATVDEDKAKLWDNKTLWKAAGALTGRDMVDKLIPYAGVKQRIIERIESLSGFDDEEDNYGDTVKN